MLTQACVWWLHSNIWVTSSVTQEYPDALHFSIIIHATLISTTRQTMLYMISPVTKEPSYVLSACRMHIKLFPRFNNIWEQGFFKSRLAQQLFQSQRGFRILFTTPLSTDPIRFLLFFNYGFVHRVPQKYNWVVIFRFFTSKIILNLPRNTKFVKRRVMTSLFKQQTLSCASIQVYLTIFYMLWTFTTI